MACKETALLGNCNLFCPFWWLIIAVILAPPLKHSHYQLVSSFAFGSWWSAGWLQNQGFQRIVQCCRGQFFRTNPFFANPDLLPRTEIAFFCKTGFIEERGNNSALAAADECISSKWENWQKGGSELDDRNTRCTPAGNAGINVEEILEQSKGAEIEENLKRAFRKYRIVIQGNVGIGKRKWTSLQRLSDRIFESDHASIRLKVHSDFWCEGRSQLKIRARRAYGLLLEQELRK